MPIYKPGDLIPDNKSLTVQQGGMLIVKKGRVIFQHFDEGTGE